MTYEIADAFHAALSHLLTTHDRDELLPGTPTLDAGPPEPIHLTKPRPKRATTTS